MLTTDNLDEIDRRILSILRQNGRSNVADIARQVGLSPAPVSRRIDRLEARGVIKGYVAVIDQVRSGVLEAFVEVRLHGATETGELDSLVRDIPEVEQAFTLAGDPDILIRVLVDDVDHLQRVVNRLRREGRPSGTRTLIVLRTWTRPQHATDDL